MRVYDVTSAAADFDEIGSYTNLLKLSQPETRQRQTAMLGFWNSHHQEFHNRLYMDTPDLISWKVRRLSHLVDWAYTTCPFYRAIYELAGYELGAIRSIHDFEALPTITKDDVIAGYPQGLVSLGHDASTCRLVGSSGSSGKQVQLIIKQHRADLDTLFKYRMFEHAGNFRLSPDNWLYNVHHAPWWHTSMLGHYRVFSVTQDCPPDVLLRHVAALRPAVISCCGSYLTKLASAAASIAQYGVRLVNTNSEPTSGRERHLAEQLFGVPVRDEYSSEEIDLIATECWAGSYHVVEDNAHVEIVREDLAGIGTVVATDLWNLAMPIIRYDQGDLASWSTNTSRCDCGCSFRRLSAFHGRANDAFRTADRSVVAPASILHAIEEHFCSGQTGFDEFRVIQRSVNSIDVLYVEGRQQPNVEAALLSFAERVTKIFGYPVTISAVPVKALPKGSGFKRKTLVCEVVEKDSLTSEAK